MKLFFLLAFIPLVFTITCNFTSKDGSFYDFSSLKDYFIPKDTFPFQSWDVWINLCRSLITTVCTSGSGVCQQWQSSVPTGHASMGVADTLQFTEGVGFIRALMTQGDNDRTTEIDFACDPSQGTGKPVFVSENPVRFYTFKWSSQYACPSASCGGGYDCNSCVSNGTCQWCLDTQQCQQKGTPTCTSYINNPIYCPAGCSQFNDCNGCTASGCSWCLDSRKCLNTRDPKCQDKVSKPIYCNLRK